MMRIGRFGKSSGVCAAAPAATASTLVSAANSMRPFIGVPPTLERMSVALEAPHPLIPAQAGIQVRLLGLGDVVLGPRNGAPHRASAMGAPRGGERIVLRFHMTGNRSSDAGWRTASTADRGQRRALGLTAPRRRAEHVHELSH